MLPIYPNTYFPSSLILVPFLLPRSTPIVDPFNIGDKMAIIWGARNISSVTPPFAFCNIGFSVALWFLFKELCSAPTICIVGNMVVVHHYG